MKLLNCLVIFLIKQNVIYANRCLNYCATFHLYKASIFAIKISEPTREEVTFMLVARYLIIKLKGNHYDRNYSDVRYNHEFNRLCTR